MERFDWKILIPWLLSVATIAIGIWQYTSTQAQANREPFLKKQLDLVFEATDVVSTLANTTDPKLWEEKRARFWQLYYGALGVVEDPQVQQAMADAGRLIPATEDPTPPTLPLMKLRPNSLKLSHAARELILESWDVSLPSLQGVN